MEEPTFELGAGAICLDLANTWGGRPDPAAETLERYDDVVAWALRTGSLTAEESQLLLTAAARRPAAAARAVDEARALRESAFRALAAQATGRPPNLSDLDSLNRALERAMSRLRICPGETCCGWSWEFSPDDLDRPLWPAVRSAAELLTAGDDVRIHECEAPDCSWLFIDRSRGGRRRWCDMSTCGNREKARRHYRRRKAEEGGP